MVPCDLGGHALEEADGANGAHRQPLEGARREEGMVSFLNMPVKGPNPHSKRRPFAPCPTSKFPKNVYFNLKKWGNTGQQIRSKIESFQNANFLISQPNPMMLPLVGIVSERRFQ